MALVIMTASVAFGAEGIYEEDEDIAEVECLVINDVTSDDTENTLPAEVDECLPDSDLAAEEEEASQEYEMDQGLDESDYIIEEDQALDESGCLAHDNDMPTIEENEACEAYDLTEEAYEDKDSISIYIDEVIAAHDDMEMKPTFESISESSQNINVSAIESRIFELTNIERINYGLPALVWNDDVAKAARLHSQDLAENNMTGHIGSDGSTVGDRLTNVGVSFTGWSENVAFGSANPEALVQALMESPGHRANILNSNRTHLGVGFFHIPDSIAGFYTTQKFVTSTTLPTDTQPPDQGQIPNEPPTIQPEPPAQPQPPTQPDPPIQPHPPTQPPIQPGPPTETHPPIQDQPSEDSQESTSGSSTRSSSSRRPATRPSSTQNQTTNIANQNANDQPVIEPNEITDTLIDGQLTDIINVLITVDNVPDGQHSIKIPDLPDGVFLPDYVDVYDHAFELALRVTDLALAGTHILYIIILDSDGNELTTTVFTITIDISQVDAPQQDVDLTPPDAQLLSYEPSTLRLAIDNAVYEVDDIPEELTPFIDEAQDRLMVPLRLISEAFGADVNWTESTRTVTLTKNDININLQLDTPLPDDMGTVLIVGGRTFVPIDYIAQMLGLDASWDGVDVVISAPSAT